MKKSKKLSLLFLFVALVFSAIFGFTNFNTNINTYAASDDINDIRGSTYEDYDMDKTLYNALVRLIAPLNNGTTSGFDVDFFSNGFKTAEVLEGSGGEVLKQDLTNGILDLTTGSNAKYSWMVNSKPIKDITGLNALQLNNIKTLILNDNNISNIEETDFSSLSAMKTLTIENNGLSSFELNGTLSSVNELNLTNNNLSSIDLSTLQISSGIRPKVDLSNNKFTTTSTIQYPNSGLSKLDLSFNNLINIDFDEINMHMVPGIKADILLQGVKDLTTLKAGDCFDVYQGEKVEKLSVRISYNEAKSSFYVPGEDNVICQTTGEQDKETIYIPAGEIVIEFLSDGEVINETNFPGLDEVTLKKLATVKFSAKLKAPSYSAYVEGKKVTNLNQNSEIKIIFEVADEQNIPNIEDVKDSAVFYSELVSTDSSFKEKDTHIIKENGSYTIRAYAMFDGILTDTINIDVKLTNMAGITIGIVIIVVVFVVVAAIYYVLRWIKEGATVAPLSDKEIFNLKRKQEKKMGYSREDFISDLDKPRHDDRVSDLGYSDDEVKEDLKPQAKFYETYSSKDDNEVISIDANIDDI